MTDILQRIRDLQFQDKAQAEVLLLDFLRDTTPYDVAQVELTPKAISLNSFNGFMTLADGQRYFFKTHTETHTIIDEYYNSELLAQAGYPVIQPVFKSAEPGKQILVYEVIQDPAVFDLAWQIENGNESHLSELTQAQQQADDDLLFLYARTFQPHAPNKPSPIHQLFYHRLVGGRLEQFYGVRSGEYERLMRLPAGEFSTYAVRRWQWVINGQVYGESLNALLLRAILLLNPARVSQTIIGHGDAHNGNVFYRQATGTLLYFDPAFAGMHPPLLDLTKPLFHNVFAMWMYFPAVMQARTPITMRLAGTTCHVAYDYPLHPIRRMFWQSKIERVLLPLLVNLKRQGVLPPDWRAALKLALLCCPLLTMNLTDGERFPPEISLLGLAMAVEMGGESQGERSLLDRTLDEVAAAL